MDWQWIGEQGRMLLGGVCQDVKDKPRQIFLLIFLPIFLQRL